MVRLFLFESIVSIHTTCNRDVVEVVEQAGEHLDTILLPKAGTASDVYMLSAMLNQIETAEGFKNRIGIEVLIETTLGMANVMDIG